MNFIRYFVAFYFYKFHIRYFRFIYRLLVTESNLFGFVAMLTSLVKPLFGTPGFFSRIQGFVLRLTALTLSLIVLSATLVLGVAMYGITIYSIFASIYLAPPLFIVLILLLVIYVLFKYYNYPIGEIKTFNNFDEYIDSGDYRQREIVQQIKNRYYDSAIETIFDSKFSIDFFYRSEIPVEALKAFLHDSFKGSELNPTEFFSKLMALNKNLGFRHLKYELFILTFLSIADPESRFLSKYKSDIVMITDSVRIVSDYYKHDFYIWDDEYQLPPSGGFDKDWAVGFSSTLNRVGTDLTKLALKGYMPKLIGREDVKEKFIATLRKRSKNNVMLLGDPGSGKSTFINAFAREIATGTPIPELRYKRLVLLDFGALASGLPGEINARVTKIMAEIMSAKNIILCIDEIHSLAAGNDPNAASIFSVLESYLRRGDFQFIATSSKQNFTKYIEPNASFAGNFDIVEMREATRFETLAIMVNVIRKTERSDGLKVSFPAYFKVIDYASKFETQRVFPDKGVELLSRVISYQIQQGKKDLLITAEHVSEFVSDVYKVPVTSLNESESQKLINLESIMHMRVIGQDLAVTNISRALKRSRVGVRDDKKPIASFLFAGPTGVGKTETAKALSEIYFGTEKSMIRVDMSEYSDPLSINRLIGTSSEPGYLTNAVRDNPFSLILFDEIEKADRAILNLFLQVLDDARLTDGNGVTADFTNTIIIMTSNIGTRDIIDTISKGGDQDAIRETSIAALKKFYAPEFLNRFTALVPFNPISQDDLNKITKLKLNGLAKKLEQKHIYITFSDEAVFEVSRLGYQPEWGARELNRVIEEKIETAIADKLIRSEIKAGDRITFDKSWMQNQDSKT